MSYKSLLLFAGLAAAAPRRVARAPTAGFTTTALGCFSDTSNVLNPIIAGTSTVLVLNSVEACGTYCNNLGYTIFGVENGEQCFCGNTNTGSPAQPILGVSQCSVPCPGNLAETCGGALALNAYSITPTTTTTTTTPVVVPPPTTTPVVVLPTTLPTTLLPTSGLPTSGLPTSLLPTSLLPTSLLPTSGLPTSLLPTSLLPTSLLPTSLLPTSLLPTSLLPTSVLPTTSGAAPTSTLALTSLGCYSDSGNILNPAIPGTSTVLVLNSPDACGTYCSSNGYTLFGLEAGVQCFCGNSITTGLAPNILGLSQCTVPCPGDLSTTCGGALALNVYQVAAASTSTTSSTTSSTTGAASTSGTASTTGTASASASTSGAASTSGTASTTSTVASGPTTVPGTSNSHYLGCYIDYPNSVAITKRSILVAGSTVESCAAACVGYLYYGVENGNECYCGNTITAVLAPGQNDPQVSGCNTVCPGNANEYCGGFDRIAIYEYNAGVVSSTTTAAVSTTATVSTTTAVSTTAAASTTTSMSVSSTSYYDPGTSTSYYEPTSTSTTYYVEPTTTSTTYYEEPTTTSYYEVPTSTTYVEPTTTAAAETTTTSCTESRGAKATTFLRSTTTTTTTGWHH